MSGSHLVSRNRCSTCKLRKVKCSGGPSPCYNCARLDLECNFPASRNESADPIENVRLVQPTVNHTEAGTVRRRTASACNECRVRKAKCSGQHPPCHRCRKRGLRCVFAQERSGLLSTTSGSHPPRRSDSPLDISGAESTGDREPVVVMQSAASILDTALEKRLLSKNVLVQHIDAYFIYVYHIPGYDFFHRSSMLEDLHNDRINPMLGVAICAAVAMYVSRSKESKQLSMDWARDVDAYIFSNLNNLSLFNLQTIILSLFQHFAYRQFGRVWLMLGMVTRLALGIRLNEDVGCSGNRSIASRECRKRLAWSIFLQDKLHAGGVEEFVALPEPWMHIPLPINETDFDQERDVEIGTLLDSFETLSHNNLGINGYLAILMNLRHYILRKTKSVIAIKHCIPVSEVEQALAPLLQLQEELQVFYRHLPPHMTLSDRNIFSKSATPEFTAYLALHTWYLQGCCDLYRICLPGVFRESASEHFLANAPGEWVTQWRDLAVSYACVMASSWRRILDMKAEGTLTLPGGIVPLSPAGCVSIHQCTKILLIAKRYQLYSNIHNPITGDPISLTDDAIGILCQSNVSFLNDLAFIAPIAAVVQRDVQQMIQSELHQSPGAVTGGKQAPVASDIQQEKILSRYHVLAMGIAASSEPEGFEHPQSASVGRTSNSSTTEQFDRAINSPSASSIVPDSSPAIGRDIEPYATADQSTQPYQQQDNLGNEIPRAHQISDGLLSNFWEDQAPFGGTPLPGNLVLDYAVPASRSNMDGELNWFLSQEF